MSEVTIKERPILFSGPMVRALLAGTKTQTRRVVKPYGRDLNFVLMEVEGGELWPHRSDDGETPYHDNCEVQIGCQYGKPGDRLWVRETWREREPDQDMFSLEYRADRPEYRTRDDDPCSVPWRPSIHMPRGASRITLEVTGVRVERVRAISEDDAIAEGVERTVTDDGWRRYATPAEEEAGLWPCATARDSYESLWQSINGPDSWAANPYVWVIEFKRADQAKAVT